MPIHYRISQDEGVGYGTCKGVISLVDIRDYRSRLRADPQFVPTMNSLADFREADEFEPSSSDMPSILQDDPFGPDSRHAAGASSDMVFGMLRMYEFKADRSEAESRVFRNMADACVRLGIPRPLADH